MFNQETKRIEDGEQLLDLFEMLEDSLVDQSNLADHNHDRLYAFETDVIESMCRGDFWTHQQIVAFAEMVTS
jgi:hypothetical protein